MSDEVSPEVVARIRAAAGASPLNAYAEDVRAMPGGHSGVTLRAKLLPAIGQPRDVVIKMTPPGRPAIGRHDVLRQARALTSLADVAGLAVPGVVLVDYDEPNLFAMDLVSGQSAEPVLDGPDLPPAETESRALDAARMLAALHAAPIDPLTLEDEPILDLSDELARWRRTMEAVPEELRPHADRLHDLLNRTVPNSVQPGILHGDYRLGNTLCGDGRVRAVIDWEIWSLGDPRVDLGWFRMFCTEDNFPEVATPAPGMPSADRLLKAYEDGIGSKVIDMAWFDALAGYKMAAIMGHNLRRHREGRHHDPYQETLVPTILRLVDWGLEVLDAVVQQRG
jgi:aminoglycoside phosphotransferase (APT) family kinase protein